MTKDILTCWKERYCYVIYLYIRHVVYISCFRGKINLLISFLLPLIIY